MVKINYGLESMVLFRVCISLTNLATVYSLCYENYQNLTSMKDSGGGKV